MALIKLFMPGSAWTWYVAEMKEDSDICYGLVSGFDREVGSFSLSELADAQGPWGLKVERDLWFTPTPLSECE